MLYNLPVVGIYVVDSVGVTVSTEIHNTLIIQKLLNES